MLLYGATSVSLIWMYFTFAKDKRHQEMKTFIGEKNV